MVLTTYAKQRIVQLREDHMTVSAIAEQLSKEGIRVSVRGINGVLSRYRTTGSVLRQPGSGRKSVLQDSCVQALVDRWMTDDDELTGKQIAGRLAQVGVNSTPRSVLRLRKSLGWTVHGAHYCQLIRDANKTKRFQWAQAHQSDAFHDVIWTDESSIQLETHKRFCCRKENQPPKVKPRPKHPIKVHVWAGISWRGRTEMVIFEGIMEASLYTDILRRALIPFLRTVYPDGHRFMQDNDPKHTSRAAKAFFEENNINWWRTPAESPDANPIENVWHELKVRTYVCI